MLTLDWLWGHPHALLQCRNVSNICLGLANGTKWTPSQKWGNLLCELHVPHRQCLAGISNAFSASFTSIWPSFPQFYNTTNKACLLCATPAVPWISKDHLFCQLILFQAMVQLLFFPQNPAFILGPPPPPQAWCTKWPFTQRGHCCWGPGAQVPAAAWSHQAAWPACCHGDPERWCW